MLRATKDKYVPWLIFAGGLVAVAGWFVGVAWLWSSEAWTRKQKVLATLFFPGGILSALIVWLFLFSTRTSDCGSAGGPGQPTVTHCIAKSLSISTPMAALLTVLIAVPIIVALILEIHRRAGQHVQNL